MSPSATVDSSCDDQFDDDLNLSIVGLGTTYPDTAFESEDVATLARRHYPETDA